MHLKFDHLLQFLKSFPGKLISIKKIVVVWLHRTIQCTEPLDSLNPYVIKQVLLSLFPRWESWSSSDIKAEITGVETTCWLLCLNIWMCSIRCTTCTTHCISVTALGSGLFCLDFLTAELYRLPYPHSPKYLCIYKLSMLRTVSDHICTYLK